MIKKYNKFIQKINEESGIKDINSLSKIYSEAEIYFHIDTDGLTSCLAMKKYIEDYGIKVVDAHIIQYGSIEYAVKETPEGIMPVLVDYSHGKPFYIIATDHHQKQTGIDANTSTKFKATRSNVETISGEISPGDVFTSTDIELIKTVDSADFLKHNITPEDVQNCIFNYDRKLSPTKNRFLMGLVVNRLILAFKNKRLTVVSLDGKNNHINRNLLECLVMDCKPSLYSIFNNIRHYINNAVSLEWDRSARSHSTPKKLATPEEITANLAEYIETRKSHDSSGTKHKDIDFDPNYKILKQYGIGSVFKSGSYDRYVVFKNFPEANFVCTIFPMGLIQVSCNPFKEKDIKDVNLGEIAKEVLGNFKYQLSNINIPISEIKKINEYEIDKMKSRYGDDYEAVGFKFSDLVAFYKDSIVYLPNRRQGDMKTRGILDLSDDTNEDVILLKEWMDVPYDTWDEDTIKEVEWLKIPILKIIEESSGGHKAITNIQGLNYLGSRRDLLQMLFKTRNHTDIMRLIGSKFVEILKGKIDMERAGKKVEYDTAGIDLKATVAAD